MWDFWTLHTCATKQQRVFGEAVWPTLSPVLRLILHAQRRRRLTQAVNTSWQKPARERAGCTWMPEVVKYGISNLTLMGGFPSLSSASTLGRPKWARIKYSFPPCQDANCGLARTLLCLFKLDKSHNTVKCKRGSYLTMVESDGVSSQGRTWLTRRSRCSRAPTWRCPL